MISVTRSFVITEKQKSDIKKWADQEDRSMSWIIRKILEEEYQRRTENKGKNNG